MAGITFGGRARAREASISLVVTRCGCGDPHNHADRGLPCPSPRAVEDLGTVAYYHWFPPRRWLWELQRTQKERQK